MTLSGGYVIFNCMIGDLINLLYPVTCASCGKKPKGLNKNLCEDCVKKMPERRPPFCVRCGKKLPGEKDLKILCLDCKDNIVHFEQALSSFYYDGLLKKLIHDFKYNNITSLAGFFSETMTGFMARYPFGSSANIVTCVPMHPFRVLKRGVNTGHILAKSLAKKLGLPYSGKLLRKIKNTPAQSRLHRTERLNNIKNSFAVAGNKKSGLKGKNILLVDDLFTTGSTVNECSRTLKNAGAASINVITLARGDKPTLP